MCLDDVEEMFHNLAHDPTSNDGLVARRGPRTAGLCPYSLREAISQAKAMLDEIYMVCLVELGARSTYY